MVSSAAASATLPVTQVTWISGLPCNNVAVVAVFFLVWFDMFESLSLAMEVSHRLKYYEFVMDVALKCK